MIDFIAVLLVVVGSLIGSYGTLLIKKGTIQYSFLQLWRSAFLWKGFSLYAISVVLYILALPRENLTVLYPLVSINYVWVTLFSVKFLQEKMNRWKWIGLGGIIVGIVLIGIGS